VAAASDNGDSQATLNFNLGKLNENQGKYKQALAYFALAISFWKEHDDREGQAVAWNRVGSTAASLKTTADAIEAYRTSVNLYQGLRADLKDCPPDVRTAFRKECERPYLALAKLLTAQSRADDAKHVLDLLQDDQAFPTLAPLKAK